MVDLDEVNGSAISDEELSKTLLHDTILYAALAKGTFPNGKLSFRLPDRTGKFRVTILGISDSGRYGTHTSFVQVQRPLDAILELPDYIHPKDELRVQLILQNNTS